MTELLELLGERIKYLRNERGLTQQQLAAAADISRDYVSLIENGRYKMTVTVLVRMANALGTDGWAVMQYAERKARK